MQWAKSARIKSILAVLVLLGATIIPLLPQPVLAAVPTITITSEVIPDVDTTTCAQTGNITATGGLAVTTRGFEYDDDGSGAPYTYDAHEDGTFSTGSFTLNLTSLSPDTTYYIRAYATNGDGTGYSAETTFHTPPANAYWVGASGNWTDDDNRWATSSGGAAGDGNLPGKSTNVFFDANSGFVVGNKTVTVNATGYCADMDWTGAPNSPIFAQGANTFFIYGSLITISAMSWTTSSTNTYFYPAGTETITTNGLTIGSDDGSSVRFGSSTYTGKYTLQDSFTVSGWIYLLYGELDTNGQSVFCDLFDVSTTTTRTLTLGASVITCINNGTAWDAEDTTNLTFNKGTSNIVISGASGRFYGGGLTYYNCEITGSSSPYITGANTFNNLTRTGTAVKTSSLDLYANQTITGTLTLNGNSATNRLLVKSDTPGTYRTLTAAAVSASNVDFLDIQGAGAATWNLSAITGGSGNAGHNAGITFTTATNCYWVDNSGLWSDITHWASSSGGVAGSVRVPLVQDNAIFDANSITIDSRVIQMDMPRIGNIDCEDVERYPQFDGDGAGGGTVYLYGDVVLGDVNFTPTTTYFYGRGTQEVTSNDNIFDCVVYLYNYNAVWHIEDDFVTTNTLYLIAGTLNMQGLRLTCNQFNSATTTYTRSLAWQGGEVYLTYASPSWNIASTNLTIGTNTGNIIFNPTSGNAIFLPASLTTYNNIYIQGSTNYTTTISSVFTCNNLIIDRSEAAKTLSGNYTITLTNSLSIPVNGVTTVTITNTDFSIASGVVCSDYLVLSGSSGAGGASFYAGSHSTNSGGNSGWSFTDCDLPNVSTLAATNITLTTATLNANLTDLGDWTTVYGFFQYDKDGTFTPTFYDETTEQTLNAIGTFDEDISGLDPEIIYYFRAVIRYEAVGYIYGTTLNFASYDTPSGYIPGYDPTVGVSSLPGATDHTDALETTTTEDQYAIGPCSDCAGLPGGDLIHTIAVALSANGYDTSKTETMMCYSATGIFVLVVVISLLFLIPGHLLISGIGALASIGLAVSVGIFPWWTIAVAVMYLAATLMQEKANWTG